MTDFAIRRQVMVDTQIRPSDVTKFPIIDAMLTVEREAYLPDGKREAAYVGENVDLGDARVVLEPRTFAKLLEALNIQPDEMVLDIGCGLGYSTAVIERLAEAVVAVEENSDMAAEAQSLLSSYGSDCAAVLEGELERGAAKHGPYDVIVIEGGVEHIPAALSDQLNEGGRIGALFMVGALGVVRVGYKRNGQMNWRDSFNASAPVLPGFGQLTEFSL